MKSPHRPPRAHGTPSRRKRLTIKGLVIPDGWFQGKKAELKSTAGSDWARIEGEVEFCVKDGKIISGTEYDQRDLQYVYDLF